MRVAGSKACNVQCVADEGLLGSRCALPGPMVSLLAVKGWQRPWLARSCVYFHDFGGFRVVHGECAADAGWPHATYGQMPQGSGMPGPTISCICVYYTLAQWRSALGPAPAVPIWKPGTLSCIPSGTDEMAMKILHLFYGCRVLWSAVWSAVADGKGCTTANSTAHLSRRTKCCHGVPRRGTWYRSSE